MLPQKPQHLQLTSNPYLIDHLQFMLEQEETHYQVGCDDYFPPWAAVSSSDRQTMCSWSYDIVNACSIPREVACIAMSYFDRFMCTSSRRALTALASRREFQLAFITCLIIALKCRAGMQVDSDFVSDTICQKLYCEEEIIKMEKEILSALQWRLNGPSPHEFIGGLVELLPSHDGLNSEVVEQLKTMSHVQVEAAMLDYSMALQSPSSIAYVALLTAMQNLSTGAFHPLDRLSWMQNIAMVTGMKASDMSSRVIRDRLFEVSQSPSSRSSNSISNDHSVCTTPTVQGSYTGGYNMSQMALEQAFTYCSPVSSTDSSIASTQTENNEDLFFDALSMASSTSMSSDFSPVCAILDGRL